MSLLSIKVLLADDHALVAEGLVQLLDSEVNIVGTARNGEEVVQLAQRLRPDVILLDAMMAQGDGFDTTRRLRQLVPESKVIFVTMLAEPTSISEAFRAGAKGYVLKQAVVSDLLEAIQAVVRSERYLSPSITGAVREALEFPWTKPEGYTIDLTKRQQEILRLLTRGCTTKKVAQILRISPKTVEFHKTAIFNKLGIQSPSDLTKFALTHGLTTLDEPPEVFDSREPKD